MRLQSGPKVLGRLSQGRVFESPLGLVFFIFGHKRKSFISRHQFRNFRQRTISPFCLLTLTYAWFLHRRSMAQ